MKERPVLFTAPMVRAILEERKSMTRRIAKVTAEGCRPGMITPLNCYTPRSPKEHASYCPYGQPGDRLVFLCTWSAPKEYDKVKPSLLPHDARIWTLFDGTDKPGWCGKMRPVRFMPNWMRTRMPRGEITGVLVERVQDISEQDARAEGVFQYNGRWWDGNHVVCGPYRSPKEAFRALWDPINAKRGYGLDKNPHVWAISFRRIK